MSAPHLKVEASPTPTKDTSTLSTMTSNMEPVPSLPVPEWRRYDGDNRLKRIQIKEMAVKNGAAILNEMRQSLDKHLHANESCQPRIAKIDTILARKQDLKTYVGFLGATGSGKTALINALIGYQSLLPSSDEMACTATPVEVAWDDSEETRPPFRADVVYVTLSEWRHELEQILTDITSPPPDDDSDDGEPDKERRMRIKTTFDKLRCVYPHLKSIDQLKATSINDLLEHPDVRDILGEESFVKCIAERYSPDFSNAITSHVASGDPDSDSTAHWPLVKQVKIYVKSPILAGGIILVDLPGNSDNNTARSTVAENYSRKFTKTCIVSPATRAMSEQNAHELLEKTAKRNMQLDGLYNPDSLCFIVSQNDRELNYIEYLKSHPSLAKTLAEDKRDLFKFTTKLNELQIAEKAAYANHEETSKRIEVVSSRLAQVKERLDGLASSEGFTGQKRKRVADDEIVGFSITAEELSLKDEKARLENELSELKSGSLPTLYRRINSIETALWHTKSRLWSACIKNRNRIASKAITNDFETTLKELGRKSTGELRVFCVSSRLHLRYLRNGSRHMAFPNFNDTQIPALREWLIASTLEPREQYAQAFLEDVEAFLNSMLPWVHNKYGDAKMTVEQREFWEPQLGQNVVQLRKELSSLNAEIIENLKKTVQKKLFAKFPEMQRVAAARAPSIARGWCNGILWMTHRAINKRGGVPYTDAHGKSHRWNDDLCDALMSVTFKKSWDQTFFQSFPSERDSYILKGQNIILSFAEAVADDGAFPDFKDALDITKDNILRAQILLKNETLDAFVIITKLIQEAHRVATPAVEEYLEPMYEQCGDARGKGHYARNKATHQEKLGVEGAALFKSVSKALKTSINAILDGLPQRFDSIINAVVGEINDEILLFFERNTTTEASNAERVVSKEKVLLQADLISDFEKLAVSWNSEVPVLKEPELDDQDGDLDLNDKNFRDISADNKTDGAALGHGI